MIAIFLIIFGNRVLRFFQEQDLASICRILGVDVSSIIKRRQRELIVLSVVLFFTPLSKKAYVLLLMVLSYKRHFIVLKQRLKTLEQKLSLQFSIWLRMLEVLVAYNTVPVAIAASVDEAPALIKPSLEIFAKNLVLNPHDRALYVSFLKEFDSIYIERTMNNLYHYALVGTDQSASQLSVLIQENAQTLSIKRNQLFEARLGFYSWFGLMPMLWVSMVFLGLMFLVVTTLMQRGWAA